jgi:GH18 family chitinase
MCDAGKTRKVTLCMLYAEERDFFLNFDEIGSLMLRGAYVRSTALGSIMLLP